MMLPHQLAVPLWPVGQQMSGLRPITGGKPAVIHMECCQGHSGGLIMK